MRVSQNIAGIGGKELANTTYIPLPGAPVANPKFSPDETFFPVDWSTRRRDRHSRYYPFDLTGLHDTHKAARTDKIPRQRWEIGRILATLIHHHEDKKLRSAYRQFQKFAYQTLLVESEQSTGRWPAVLGQKDWDLIINLRARIEIEKRYNHEVQDLCKTPCFGAVDARTHLGTVDKGPLDEILDTARLKGPMLSSLVLSVRPSTRQLALHLVHNEIGCYSRYLVPVSL